MFYNVRAYFENACQSMKFDHHENLLDPNGATWDNALCSDFDSYCFTAAMLKEKGLYAECGRALSKALGLVEQILRAKHPRTLACFLEVFIHLLQSRLPEVTSLICRYIRGMSEAIEEGHHWGQICRLLGELDSDQAMAQIWKFMTDLFDHELGESSRFSVSVSLDYIKRVVTDPREEERLLRSRLAQLGEPTHPTPRVMLNLAHSLNKQGRHEEAEQLALQVLSLLRGHEMYAERIVERIESRKIISRSQFYQGQPLAAEETMREAIRMVEEKWGKEHSWVPEFMTVLEGWLRVSGREVDANRLRGEIDGLIGTDEVDEELGGVQGLRC